MKYLFLLLATSISLNSINAQTNPTALTLPVNENFGTTTFSVAKPGMASWTGDGVRPYTTQALAEASGSGADQAIVAGDPVSAGSGGQYGGAPSANGRLSILQSSNATSGSTQIVMAINTTGATSVNVAYDLTMPVVNPRDFGIALQYRIGTTGLFTTIAGSAIVYSNTSTNGGDADGPTDYDSYTYTLPTAAAGVAEVQLRWISWNATGTGSRSAVGIDNIVITSGAVTPCAEPTAQPSALTLTPASTSISGSFTAASPVPNNYLVVYSTSSTLSAQPVDGSSYTVGQALGGGTIGAITATNTFTLNSLTSSTLYYVFIYSLNNLGCSGGPNYLVTTPLLGNTTTLSIPGCITPALPATALVLTPTSNTINGSFTASATANKYLVIRSTANTLSASPVNGTTYVSGASFGGGTIVQFNAATTFSSVGLTANTIYYYYIFAANGGCTGEPFYLLPALLGNVTTLNTTSTGYYNAAAGLSCQALKTALYNITSTGTTVLSYTPGVWNAYQTTDLTRNFANTADIIYDMYSNKGPGIAEPYQFTFGTNQCGNYSGESNCYNREHSMPQSWFNSASPMVSDIHHVVPTDGYVNGQRGNFAFGPVGTATYTSQNGSKKGNCSYPGFSGTVFEPINEFKGDFARMQLYMAVRYENVIASWQNNGNANDVLNGTSYQVFDDWYIKMLYDWHQLDPVSAKEIARNNAVYAIQGNRNPFIDSAQFVYKIWGCIPGLLPSNVPPPNPVVINVTNKCQNDATAKGKLTNPPLNTTIAITVNGAVTPYNTVDSSFVYFTNGVTSIGTYSVLVNYTNANGNTSLTIPFTVAAVVTPTINITGNGVVLIGQSATLSSTITNGGTAPTYQWQDSTSAAGWQNIATGVSSTINYSPIATGNKLRCRITSNGTCVAPTQATSNTITFTVNTVTAINTVSANNYGIQLFPNPVIKSINLYSLKVSDKWLTVSVVSINGKNNILQKNIQNQTSTQIDAANLPSGIYYIVLKRTNAKSAYIKFVKL
jgi:endonuclease I